MKAAFNTYCSNFIDQTLNIISFILSFILLRIRFPLKYYVLTAAHVALHSCFLPDLYSLALAFICYGVF